jgi:hypothetical protein
VVNLKRVRRIYREANLQVRKRLRRRVALGRGNPAPSVASINERWSLDFVHDTFGARRRLRALTIVDDFTHESLAIIVDTSLFGERVTRVLDMLGEIRGLPKTIVMDNGTELTSLAMLRWAADRRARLHHNCAREADAECIHRKLQRALPRRMPQRTRLRDARRSPRDHRSLAPRLQRATAPLVSRQPHPNRVRPRPDQQQIAYIIGITMGLTSTLDNQRDRA